MIKICECCKKQFETDTKRTIYCSKKCCQDAYRERRYTEKEKIIKQCVVCGEFFEADRETAVCCSDHCRAIRKKLREQAKTPKRKTTNTQKLVEDAKKAREAGLTYGKWQERQYTERERT